MDFSDEEFSLEENLAEEEDWPTVLYCLSQGANVHAKDDYTLVRAAAASNLQILKYLVSIGANIRAQNDAALQEACGDYEFQFISAENHNLPKNYDFSVITYLLEMGLNPQVILLNPSSYANDVFQFIQNWVDQREHQRRYNLSLGYIESAPPGYYPSIPQGGVGYQEVSNYFK